MDSGLIPWDRKRPHCPKVGRADLLGITAIGVDELHWGKGKGSQRFLTLVYQIDAGSRRLLWIGRTRTQRCLVEFFRAMQSEVLTSIRFICSDLWKPFFEAIVQSLPQANRSGKRAACPTKQQRSELGAESVPVFIITDRRASFMRHEILVESGIIPLPRLF